MPCAPIKSPVIRLSEYRPPDFLIDHVALDFQLHPTETVVEAMLTVRRNPKGHLGAALVLDGEELKLLSVALDGKALGASAYEVSPENW